MRQSRPMATFISSLFAMGLTMTACAQHAVDTTNKALLKAHTTITKNYEGVSHINTDTLSKLEPESYVLFDVREKDEFAVSHIENSIWVDPSIDASSFNELYSEQIGDKTIVLYCSVGVRSSRLAEKLLEARSSGNIRPIYNLQTGVFGWHNESRPLVTEANSTDFIHPYNRLWGRMVNRESLKRYDLDGN